MLKLFSLIIKIFFLHDYLGLTKAQKVQIESQVKRILGVAFMPEDLTGNF
jgi:hypothetical protein